MLINICTSTITIIIYQMVLDSPNIVHMKMDCIKIKAIIMKMNNLFLSIIINFLYLLCSYFNYCFHYLDEYLHLFHLSILHHLYFLYLYQSLFIQYSIFIIRTIISIINTIIHMKQVIIIYLIIKWFRIHLNKEMN